MTFSSFVSYRQPKEKKKMCNIGKPLEILDVEPLNLPAPLRLETEQPVTVSRKSHEEL